VFDHVVDRLAAVTESAPSVGPPLNVCNTLIGPLASGVVSVYANTAPYPVVPAGVVPSLRAMP
jgi:hypothetical protein